MARTNGLTTWWSTVRIPIMDHNEFFYRGKHFLLSNQQVHTQLTGLTTRRSTVRVPRATIIGRTVPGLSVVPGNDRSLLFPEVLRESCSDLEKNKQTTNRLISFQLTFSFCLLFVAVPRKMSERKKSEQKNVT